MSRPLQDEKKNEKKEQLLIISMLLNSNAFFPDNYVVTKKWLLCNASSCLTYAISALVANIDVVSVKGV